MEAKTNKILLNIVYKKKPQGFDEKRMKML